MATPRVKRALAGSASDPAQRPITSFFARDENTWSHGDGASERASRSPSYDTASPLLPPNVQANLLAVGMRVRKSVPEGYKTGKEVDERATPSHYQPQPKAPSSSSTASYKLFLQSAGRPAATQAPATRAQSQRELLPFCGLNKIGGLGVQASGSDEDRPMFASALFGGMDDDATVAGGGMGDMEPPSLTSSQETVSSMASYLSASQSQSQPQSQAPAQVVYATKKRLLGDEDEDENEGAYNRFHVHEDMHQASWAVPTSTTTSINSWLADGQISPRTQAPLLHMGRRVLAVPRRRQQQQSPSLPVPQAMSESPKLADGQLDSSIRVHDQENADDIDEADFLGDMEMSDM